MSLALGAGTEEDLQTTDQLGQPTESPCLPTSVRTSKQGASDKIVIDTTSKTPSRTACAWGLSPSELELWHACVHLLRRKGCGVFVTVEDYAQDTAERRGLFRRIKSDIAKYQRELGMRRRWYVEVLESYPGLHSHIVVVVPTALDADWLICRLSNSATYGERLECKRVWDWNGLQNYLSGEATSQAWYKANRAFPRVPKSRSGEMTGDRIRPSRDVENTLLTRGDIQRRQRTYAKSERAASAPSKPLQGTAKAPTPPLAPIQLALPLDLAPVPPILKLVEEKRVEQKLTQREAARLLGIKQAGYSNAVVRLHDRLSPWAMNRAREFVADRLVA